MVAIVDEAMLLALLALVVERECNGRELNGKAIVDQTLLLNLVDLLVASGH
eukprot:m.354416 g.354416  ORF g.354416 m.354416 type:complete len:51 (+) comp17009_c0_seq1:156-308(+)